MKTKSSYMKYAGLSIQEAQLFSNKLLQDIIYFVTVMISNIKFTSSRVLGQELVTLPGKVGIPCSKIQNQIKKLYVLY